MQNLACELFERCRAAATDAHRVHLVAEPSGFRHEALGEFYHGIIDLVDTFMESYLGTSEKIGCADFPVARVPRRMTSAEVVTELLSWVKSNRDEITDASELQNVIDEICNLCNQTLYKLTRLR